MSNSDSHSLMYKMHECIKVLVSLYFPEKDSSDVILGSLKDWTEGDCGKRMCKGEIHGGIGIGESPRIIMESDETSSGEQKCFPDILH